ncbi:MAG: 3-methyl-2-oxobutanoate hydroxymethyltransferase [Synergistaceae bacterium]|nr:3-methyl-2-oxobutanoate hydroxymethyltransferase [Synergistaceae bacterium]
MAKVTTLKVQEMKDRGEKITMTTAYDYATMCVVERAGIEIVLVGDSLMMTVMGQDSTVPCTMEIMIHHIRAVMAGAKDALVVGDLPFGSYNVSPQQAVESANRLMKEGGCDCVKLEGGVEMAPVVKAIVDSGTPVFGHVGLTPQTTSKMGGFKVQGKGEAAEAVLQDALAIEGAGAFAIVLEGIPEALGKLITKKLRIPTIGIGAGRYTDGQVLVFHDMLGFFDKFVPKFVKQYLHLNEEIVRALGTYKDEVKDGRFPTEEHVFAGVTDEELSRLY